MLASAATLIVAPAPLKVLLELLAMFCSVVALLVSPVLVELLLELLVLFCSVVALLVSPALLELLLELLELPLESSSVFFPSRRDLGLPVSGKALCVVGRETPCSDGALVWAWIRSGSMDSFEVVCEGMCFLCVTGCEEDLLEL